MIFRNLIIGLFVSYGLNLATVCVAQDNEYARPYKSEQQLRREYVDRMNKRTAQLKGEVKFDNGNSRKLQGSHFDSSKNQMVFTTDRAKHYDYHTSDGRIIRNALVVREEARVDLNTRDEEGRYLVTFPDAQGPNQYWVPASQLGLSPKKR